MSGVSDSFLSDSFLEVSAKERDENQGNFVLFGFGSLCTFIAHFYAFFTFIVQFIVTAPVEMVIDVSSF